MLTSSRILPIAVAVSACFATSTASAAENLLNIYNGEETPYTENIKLNLDSNYAGLNNSGFIVNDSVIISNSKKFTNTGTIKTGLMNLDVYQVADIGGTIHASEKFVYRGASGNNFRQGLSATVVTPLLEIIGKPTAQTGLEVQSQSVIDGIDAVRVESHGIRTMLAFKDGQSFDYAGTVTLSDEDARVEVGHTAGGTQVTLAEVISEQGKTNIQVNEASSVNVQSIKVQDQAKLELGAWGSGDQAAGTITLSELSLGKGSKLTSIVYGGTAQTLSLKGDLVMTMDEGAMADFTQVNQEAEAKFAASSLTVNVLDAHSGNQVLLSDANSTLDPVNVSVTGAPSSNTGNAEADLNALGDIVQYATKTNEGETTTVTVSDVEGVKVEQLANDLYDGASATVGKNGLENVTVKQNTNILGIAEMSTLGLHIWRNEINDMNKRLGELRDSRGQNNGLWARVYTGEAEIGSLSVENDYTAFQFGYDRQIMPNVFVGAAFSYTDGESDFTVGGGDNKIYALTAYGSYVADSGLFVDVTAKYGRLDNEFDIGLADGTTSSGDYDANAFSMSAEAGWRYGFTDMFFVEPQIEMMYGVVEGVDYATSTGLAVHHEKADTFIGRAGFVLGANCPDNKGNAYVRASVLHDFLGEANYSFAKNGDVRHLSNDLGGTWYEFGIGANINWSDNLHSYVDVETSSGGEVDTDYRVNVGIRYGF